MKRIVVVGVTGSGKTTLAQRLSQSLRFLYVELDALHWEPGWKEADPEAFRERVLSALNSDHWVVDGNYGKVRDIVWPRADTVVWLDFPLWTVLGRLFWRTIRRIASKENLWGSGNRESWRTQFLSRESLFLWALQTHARRRREYPVLFTQPEYMHLQVIHLRSPRAAGRWLEVVAKEKVDA